MALHAENWFPSPIWSGLLKGVDNDAIETFAYDRKNLDPEGTRLSNYIGWQSNSIRYGDNEAFDKLMQTISEEVDACAAQTGLPKLNVQNVWMNINSPGAYNHLHNHAGSILSGVYYVKSQPEQGNIFFERGDDAEYFLPPIEEANYFTSTATTYKATTGAIYIFPGWLKHSVQPNLTADDRLSISFNYGIVNQ
mgnify:CR=1 FL=1|jgi:uncharacterized protein (TIGR02466 family)|tara:strand:+ start:7101 stop:7682 length:582 start_codon:yes stop_codon:yes gene_type:complete